jgi:hypothetical protein
MAYVLIPDGFALKKVTKAQQDAVDEYFGRERRGSYLNTLIDNPNTATLVIGTLTGGVLLSLINKFFSEGGPFTAEEIAEKLSPANVVPALVETTSPATDIESAFSLVQEALRKKKEQEA